MKILVPVDGSSHALDAARFAGRLAAMSDGEVVLLHVISVSSMRIMEMAGKSTAEIRTNLEAESAPLLDPAEAVVRACSVEQVRQATRLGYPSEEIISYADKHNIDLIVLGSRGHARIRGLLLGSVSETVVRRAHCPVTVVR